MLKGATQQLLSYAYCQSAIAEVHNLELLMIGILDFGILAGAVRTVA
jgi:hypothetical protein